MTPTKIYDISIILIIVCLLTSCSIAKNIQDIQNSSVVLQENYSYYINDSLNFSYRFPGCCYSQITSKQKIKENLNMVDEKLPLTHCICLLSGFCYA